MGLVIYILNGLGQNKLPVRMVAGSTPAGDFPSYPILGQTK